MSLTPPPRRPPPLPSARRPSLLQVSEQMASLLSYWKRSQIRTYLADEENGCVVSSSIDLHRVLVLKRNLIPVNASSANNADDTDSDETDSEDEGGAGNDFSNGSKIGSNGAVGGVGGVKSAWERKAGGGKGGANTVNRKRGNKRRSKRKSMFDDDRTHAFVGVDEQALFDVISFLDQVCLYVCSVSVGVRATLIILKYTCVCVRMSCRFDITRNHTYIYIHLYALLILTIYCPLCHPWSAPPPP